MRIIYLGTPDFAIKPLDAILKSRHEVIAVVTQPDKPVGRKNIITPCDLKKFALEKGVNVLSYEKIRRDGVDELKSLCPDIMVTCAYGQILSQEIIDIPKYGIINIHGSLLPKYRGAAPIQRAVLDGEKESGVTIMQTDAGIDTGDIIREFRCPIDDDMTAGELFDKLSELGGSVICDVLDDIEKGRITKTKQDESKATLTKMIKKEEAVIDFSKTALEIKNLVRGMNPWPVAYTQYEGKILKVYKAEVRDNTGNIGEVISSQGELVIGTGEKSIAFTEVQLEGGKRMGIKDFLLGHHIEKGKSFVC